MNLTGVVWCGYLQSPVDVNQGGEALSQQNR